MNKLNSLQMIGRIRRFGRFGRTSGYSYYSTPSKSQLLSDFEEFKKLSLSDPKFQSVPQMLISFTCKVCNFRSHKSFSKHSYEKGVVIIKCEKCLGNHLIADNLGFTDSLKKVGKLSDFLNEKIATNKDLEELLHVDEGVIEGGGELGHKK
jgi:hypothetical protein